MGIGAFFKIQKPKERLAIVFDIGSASVGASLVLLVRDNSPRILYTVRKDMVVQKDMDIAVQEW